MWAVKAVQAALMEAGAAAYDGGGSSDGAPEAVRSQIAFWSLRGEAVKVKAFSS
jgi:hypothetical protein